METQLTKTSSFNETITAWLKVKGDLDDFIFYFEDEKNDKDEIISKKY